VRKIVLAIIACILVGMSGLWFMAGQLSAAAPLPVGPPPQDGSFEDVGIDGVHGWYIQGNENHKCLLLMHGVRSSRREMVGRARLVKEHGYSALVIDLQAHGESPGEEITFGYREARSAKRAVSFLRSEKKCETVVALGRSLGGAAALLGHEPLAVEGYILEAVYPSIEKAVGNRLQMRVGPLGKYLAPLLYRQIPMRWGIELEDLRPAQAIRRIRSPVLILNGTEDRRTTVQDAVELFGNAPKPKTLVWVEGAGHTDLFEFNRALYGEVMLRFLDSIH
jgi:pimeloyl-ACP methyl ester carboxylesterase